MQEEQAALAGDNKRLSRANKKLNAENNGIKRTKTVPGKDRTGSGRPGRQPGCKPTINRRSTEIDREETVDVTTCPDGHPLSEKVSDSYTKVVRFTHVWHENVEFTVNRRWCPHLQKDRLPPGRPGSASTRAARPTTKPPPVSLHMSGLSHGKAAEFSGDVLKCSVSRSTSYRDKIAVSRKMVPRTRRYNQKDPERAVPPLRRTVVGPVAGSNGGAAMVALGEKACLVMVVDSATIKCVREMIPGYQGTIIQDSKTIWLHGSPQPPAVHVAPAPPLQEGSRRRQPPRGTR